VSRSLRVAIVVIVLLGLGLAVAAAVLIYTADYNRYRGLIADAITDATGRQVTIDGDLDITFSVPPALAVNDVTVANASWGSQPQMAHVGQLLVRLKILPLLLRRDVDVSSIKLIDTDFLFEVDADGKSNWSFAHKPGSGAGFRVRQVAVAELEIDHLKVTVSGRAAGSPAAHYEVDQLALSRTAQGDALDVSLKGRSNAQPVSLEGRIGLLEDLLAGTRFPVTLSGDLAGATTKIDGAIDNVLKLEGLDLTVKTSGTNLATVGAAIGTEIPRTDSFDLTARLTGSGNDLAMSGASGRLTREDIKLELSGGIGKLAALEDIELSVKCSGSDLSALGPVIDRTLPATGAYEVSGKLTGSARTLTLSDARGSIALGGIDLAATGGINELVTLEGVDLVFQGSGNDLAELGAVIGEKLPQTGPFELDGHLTGSSKALALGDARGTITYKSAKATLTGRIGDLAKRSDIKLDVRCSGNDLAEIGPIFGEKLPTTGAFQLSGTLSGNARALALSGARGEIGSGSVKLSATGGVDELMTQKGIHLDVEVSGKNLGELRSLLGDKLPDTGPFSAAARLTGSARAPATKNLRGSIAYKSSKLVVSGEIADPLQPAGIKLDLHASGKDLGELGPLLDRTLPDLGPFDIKGQLEGSNQLVDLTGLSVTVDQSDAAGWVKVELAKRPKITAALESGLIDFTRILDQVESDEKGRGDGEDDSEKEPAKAEQGAQGRSRAALFSDTPLPFDTLAKVDVDLQINARNIKARDAQLDFGRLLLTLDEGDLRVDKLEATYRGAKVSANLKLLAVSPPNAQVSFLVQGYDLGRFLKETKRSEEVEGEIDLAADLTSRGNSNHELMANLDGTFGLVIGKGRVPRILDFLASDLATRVIPIWGRHKEGGQLNCGVIQFTSRQGIATSDAFLLNTQIGLLKADGEINLETEQLNFVLSPKPKDPSLFTLATKLHVTGSILDPKVRPASGSLLLQGSKGLSALALGPAGLLAPFIKTGAGKKHPCDIGALKQRVESIYGPTAPADQAGS
jgi:uncharacterized protein involved in outer membrane biogenesis